jgi:hypothetical protein
MKSTMNIIIDFFATLYDLAIDFFSTLYDLVYNFIRFILKSIIKLSSKIKRTGPLNILINFFAFQYDLVYDFIVFFWEYLQWVTNISTNKSTNFNTQAKEPIKIQN